MHTGQYSATCTTCRSSNDKHLSDAVDLHMKYSFVAALTLGALGFLLFLIGAGSFGFILWLLGALALLYSGFNLFVRFL